MMNKSISLILIFIFVISLGHAGEALSSFSNNDKLAVSYVSDPGINPDRSYAVKSGIAGDVKPGAIGNGMLLIGLLNGVMPPKLLLTPQQYENIEGKLRASIRVAMQLYTAHSNELTDNSLKEIARETFQNLVSFNNSLSRELYPFNAPVDGIENYLVGFGLDEFNREEKAALAIDFIYWLYTKYKDRPDVTLMRLAQYVFHERTPEKTIVKEGLGREPEINRDDHRRIYNRVQSVIFGRAEVDALKADLRGFINERAGKAVVTVIGLRAPQIGSMSLKQIIHHMINAGTATADLPTIIEKLRSDPEGLEIVFGVLMQYLSLWPARDPDLKLENIEIIMEREFPELLAGRSKKLETVKGPLPYICEWQIGDDVVSGFRQFLSDWHSIVEPSLNLKNGTGLRIVATMIDGIGIEKAGYYNYGYFSTPYYETAILKFSRDELQICQYNGTIDSGIRCIDGAEAASNMLVVRPGRIEIREPTHSILPKYFAKRGVVPLNEKGCLRSIRFDGKRISLVFSDKAKKFVDNHMVNLKLDELLDIVGEDTNKEKIADVMGARQGTSRIVPVAMLIQRVTDAMTDAAASAQLAAIIEQIYDVDSLKMFLNALRGRLLIARAKDSRLTADFLKKTIQETPTSTPEWVPLVSVKGYDLSGHINKFSSPLVNVYIDGRLIERVELSANSGDHVYDRHVNDESTIGDRMCVILEEAGKFDNGATYGVSTFEYTKRTSEIHINTSGMCPKTVEAKFTLQDEYEWHIGEDIKSGLRQFLRDWKARVAPTLMYDTKIGEDRKPCFKIEEKSMEIGYPVRYDTVSGQKVPKFEGKYDILEILNSGIEMRYIDYEGLPGTSKLVLRDGSIEMLELSGRYYQPISSDTRGKCKLNAHNYLKAIRFSRKTRELVFVFTEEAMSFLKLRCNFGGLRFIKFIYEESEHHDIPDEKSGMIGRWKYDNAALSPDNTRLTLINPQRIPNKHGIIEEEFKNMPKEIVLQVRELNGNDNYKISSLLRELDISATCKVIVRDKVAVEYRIYGIAAQKTLFIREDIISEANPDQIKEALDHEYRHLTTDKGHGVIRTEQYQGNLRAIIRTLSDKDKLCKDLPVRAEVFAANFKKILAKHPDQLFFMGIENGIGESQKAQIMPLYKAIDEIKELKDASGKPLFPNLMARRGKADELVSTVTELGKAKTTHHNGIEFGTLDLNHAFIGARKLSVNRNLYDSIKGEGRAWISAIDDSKPGDYLPIFESIILNMMAYLKADLTAIKNFYDTIADKPIEIITLRDMIRNRLIYILPRATKFDTKQLRKLYELAQQVYVAA